MAPASVEGGKEMSKRKRKRDKESAQPDRDGLTEELFDLADEFFADGFCVTCGCPLGLPGGMGGTGLCGPCCTGEADTLEEIGETW